MLQHAKNGQVSSRASGAEGPEDQFMAERAWFTYILRCSDDSYYVGITPDLAKRLGNIMPARHRLGLDNAVL